MAAQRVPTTGLIHGMEALTKDMASSCLGAVVSLEEAENTATLEQSQTTCADEEDPMTKRQRRRQTTKEMKQKIQEAEEDTSEPVAFSEASNRASSSYNEIVATIPLHQSEVPVLAYYTSRPALSGRYKNSKNKHTGDVCVEEQAVFATQPIKAGTRIIHEAPLITLPAPGDQPIELIEAFYKLTEEDQKRIWSLNASDVRASQQLSDIADLIDPVIDSVRELTRKPTSQWTRAERELFDTAAPKIQSSITLWRVAARWHAGRYSLLQAGDEDHGALPTHTPITGLFVETARLRHSCVPNCIAAYHGPSNKITVHTTRDVATADELTLSCIADVYYSPAADRAAALKQRFGITCTCEACDSSHANFQLHQHARTAARANAISLSSMLTRIDLTLSDHVRHKLHLAPSLPPSLSMSLPPSLPVSRASPCIPPAVLVAAESQILRLLSLLKATGCDGPEQIRWRNALVDRVQSGIAGGLHGAESLRVWMVVLGHAKACEAIAERCWGGEGDEAVKLRERREGIEGLVRVLLRE